MSLGIGSVWRACLCLAGEAGLALVPRNPISPRIQRLPAVAAQFKFTALPRRALSTPSSIANNPKRQQGKRERNSFFRNAFRPADERRIKKKLASPFVPPMRDYPSAAATNQSAHEAREIANVQIGFDRIWRRYTHEDHYLTTSLDWTDTFALLKEMTPPKTDKAMMAAMRIVLPESWDLEVGNQNVEFVDSFTGLVSKLRVSADHRNSSAIVIRGRGAALAKAADELVECCKDVKVFQLGEVAAFDYETRRLWPSIEGAADGDTLSEDELNNIWVHREQHTEHWIDKSYEDIPRPKKWTTDEFDSYIAQLVCGRLRPHLALPLYSHETKETGREDKQGHLVDTDGIRVRLIMDAFLEPQARPCITTTTLNMAISFMAQRGGHRASADRLFKYAEDMGLPMDTQLFNIMLEGYVTKRDFRFFYKFLRKMKFRYFHPNARTWLLFLQLVEKEDERRQIVVAMFELGLFDDPAIRRGIARIMASHDAYVAFRSGKSLEQFMDDQNVRYGNDWFTREALNRILKEYFLFHGEGKPKPADFAELVEKKPDDGRDVDVKTVNLILEHCVTNRDWDVAVWALSLLTKYGCEADQLTYDRVLNLAARTSSPYALAAAFFHGAHEHKLRTYTRHVMKHVFIGRHRNAFWRHNQVPLFNEEMVAAMKTPKLFDLPGAVGKAARVISESSDGQVPAESFATTVEKALRADRAKKNGDKSDEEYLEIRMKYPESESPDSTIILDRCFDPKTMVSGFKKRPPSGTKYKQLYEEPA